MLPCAHCEQAPREKGDGLCSDCGQYPRCKGCEIIFGVGVSKEACDGYCETCIDFKDRIKSNCVICGERKPTTESYFKRNGNFCVPCSTEATRHAADPTTFTPIELATIFKKFRAKENRDTPEGGHLASALYAVQRATDERKYKEMDRVRKKGSRARVRVPVIKGTTTDGSSSEGLVRGEGEEIFA